MNTYTHFLMTALAGDRLKQKEIEVNSRAFLWGSIMPDLPLFALTFGYFAYRYWIDPWQPEEHIFGPRYDNLYFNNPFWTGSHNLFHAPLIILLLLGIGYRFGLRGQKKWASALFWFALACALHSTVDIFTHHNDGPLLLFPFDWRLRFNAPISYWNPDYYGRPVSAVEHLFNFGILLYFGRGWWRRRRAQKLDIST